MKFHLFSGFLKDYATCSVPKLPALNKDVAVRSDASSQRVEDALLQYLELDNVTLPVAYTSRKLNVAEGKYGTIAGKCLTVVFAN